MIRGKKQDQCITVGPMTNGDYKPKTIMIYGRNHGKTIQNALLTAEKVLELSELGKIKVNLEIKSSQIEEINKKLTEILEILKNEE